MYKLKLSNICDIIVTYLLLFVLSFCWIRFYTKNVLLSILLANVISIILSLCFFFFVNKNSQKKQSSKQRTKLAIEYATQLQFSTINNTLTYFSKILQHKYNIKNEHYFLVLNNNTLFIPFFHKELFTLTDFTQCIRYAQQKNITNLIICSNKFENSTQNIIKSIKNYNIITLDMYQTYNQLIEPSHIAPPQIIDTHAVKLTFKEILSFITSKDRAKNYILLGLILIFSSYFVLFKTYYLITGSILLCMAIITLVLPHKHKTAFTIL